MLEQLKKLTGLIVVAILITCMTEAAQQTLPKRQKGLQPDCIPLNASFEIKLHHLMLGHITKYASAKLCKRDCFVTQNV